jgi:hypothetical protein
MDRRLVSEMGIYERYQKGIELEARLPREIWGLN